MAEVDIGLGLVNFSDPEPIGVGATATVYRAMQPDLGRFVAIKVFDRAGWALDESDRRFLDECVMAGRMSDHPNAMTIYQAGRRDDAVPFIVMELCPNGTLSDRASQHQLGVVDACAVGVRVCGALVTAHARGITHRDVKPSNIVFNVSDEPVLTDFGIGALDFGPARGAGSYTPGFAAPELTQGEPGSPAADVYGWCATFGYVVSGRLPGDVPAARTGASSQVSPGLRQVLAAGVEPAAGDRPSLPEVLDAMVEECRLDGLDVVPVILPPESAPTMVSGPESVTIISELPTIEPAPQSAPQPARRRPSTIVAMLSVFAVVAVVVWAPWHHHGAPSAGSAKDRAPVVSSTHSTTTIDLSVPKGIVDTSAQLVPKVAAALPPGAGPYPYDVVATEASYFPPSSDFPRLGALPARAVWSFVNTRGVPACTRQISPVTMTGFAGHVRVVVDRTSVGVAAVQLASSADAHTFFTGRSLSLGVDGADCVVRDHRVAQIVHRDLTPAFSAPVDEYNCWRFEGTTKQPDQLEQVAYACSARRGDLEAEVRVGFFVDTPTSQDDATSVIVAAVDEILS